MTKPPRPKKKIAIDYHAIAKANDLRWLGAEVVATHVKTPWQCLSCLCIWSTKYGHIQQGHGCRKCGFARMREKQRYGPQKYRELAKRRCITWLGQEVSNCKIRTQWRCAFSHDWWATYSDIQQGGRCTVCGLERGWIKPRLGSESYIALGVQCGFEWLGKEVRNANTKTEWRCSKGHVFTATHSNVRTGQGCRECTKIRSSEQQRHSPEKYEELAKKHKLFWVGPPVANITEKTWWQCYEGHEK